MLQVFGIALYTKGFFLTRYEILEKNSCSEKLVPGMIYGEGSNGHCWYPAMYSKAIILVIDALRYDYLEYDENLDPSKVRNNQNKLPVVNQLLKTQPDNSLLFNFRADPPSVTMQRLKGLTTGTFKLYYIFLKISIFIISFNLRLVPYESSDDDHVNENNFYSF